MNENLRKRRKDLGFTQDYVARMSGISQNAYSEIELGHYMPRLFVAFKISFVLDYDIRLLFSDIFVDAFKLTLMRLEEDEKSKC